MANSEHLKLLNKGTGFWNKWRQEFPEIIPDLSETDFSRMPVMNYKMVPNSPLWYYDNAPNRQSYAIADFRGKNLNNVNLQGVLFNGALLLATSFWNSNLKNADFENAILGGTLFVDTSLSEVKNLETCIHRWPSIIDHFTIRKSKLLPSKFLRGLGFNDWEIESINLYNLDLTVGEIIDTQQKILELRAGKPIQIHNLFISYSHEDNDFIEYLEKHLELNNIRFWRDVHHATSGPLEKIITSAIKIHPIVLIVLSKFSVNSDWVEFEAEKARKLEKEIGRTVLCPIALDASWKECNWSQILLNQIKKYHILDFSNWRDENSFKIKYKKLIDGLDLFYEK